MSEWTYKKACSFVNMDHPAILSLLYDLDLLPEQIESDEKRAQMILIVAHFITAEKESPPPADGGLREEVRWFAGEMERQLRANKGKGSWDECERIWLASQAKGNLDEIERLDYEEKDAIVKAAADAANFCMMIADNRTWPRAALGTRKEGKG